jgi:hypothetical protein
MLTKQTVYHLSHVSSPFCSGYLINLFIVVLGLELRAFTLSHTPPVFFFFFFLVMGFF